MQCQQPCIGMKSMPHHAMVEDSEHNCQVQARSITLGHAVLGMVRMAPEMMATPPATLEKLTVHINAMPSFNILPGRSTAHGEHGSSWGSWAVRQSDSTDFWEPAGLFLQVEPGPEGCHTLCSLFDSNYIRK